MKIFFIISTILILIGIVMVVRWRLRGMAQRSAVSGTAPMRRFAQLQRLDTVFFGAAMFTGVCWLTTSAFLKDHWLPLVLRNLTIAGGVAVAGVSFLIGWHQAGGASE